MKTSSFLIIEIIGMAFIMAACSPRGNIQKILPQSSNPAHQSFNGNPDSAVFVTSDISNFWAAYDKFYQDTTQNPFGADYIDIGSNGVRGFLKYRIQDKDYLRSVVIEKKSSYDNVRSNTLRLSEKEKQCRSIFYAMKYWYPEAVFPPVYCVIGAFNSGGTVSNDGLIIGTEIQQDIDNIPYDIAHELIHFQQNKTYNPTLLTQAIHEGSADFLGELISGYSNNTIAMIYGNAHKDSLCKEFVSKMNDHNFMDWLYEVSGKDDRPNDLGYWIGYEIARAYFVRQRDKKQAVARIIKIEDYTSFLYESGYLTAYMQ